MLNKDLKNALSEIKRLSAENEQLKKKGNQSKDGCSPESDNEFIPVQHRKQPRSGRTVFPREHIYTKQTQNESFLSANKYSCSSNITPTEVQEAENDSESQEHGRKTQACVPWLTVYQVNQGTHTAQHEPHATGPNLIKRNTTKKKTTHTILQIQVGNKVLTTF
jgi:hypothetical protein